MASISMQSVVLFDGWPGTPNPNVGPPTNGYDSTKEGSGNCVSTPLFPIGEKRMGYNDATHNPGGYTMCYMQFAEGSDFAYDIGAMSQGYRMCFHYEATQHHPDGNNAGTWYVVSTDLTNTDGTEGGAVAFPACDLSGADTTLTNGPEFGWMWVGGVCPCITLNDAGGTDMTKLGNNITTSGDVAAGNFLITSDLTNAGAPTAMCPTEVVDGSILEDSTHGWRTWGKSYVVDA